jgi:hypothetical protein
VNTTVDSGKALNGRKKNIEKDLEEQNVRVWTRNVCLGGGEL